MTFSTVPGLCAMDHSVAEVKIEITISGDDDRARELLRYLIAENRMGARVPLSIPIPGLTDLKSAWVLNLEGDNAGWDPLSLEITLMGSDQEAS